MRMHTTAPPAFLTRRGLLKLFTGALLAAGGAAAYVRRVEPHWLAVEEVPLLVPHLPASLEGKRLVQLSDIHLSEFTSPARLAGALARVRALAPDWLVLTGDYVGRKAGAAEGLVEPLRTLDLPVLAVFGNHDLWTHRPTVQRYLEAAHAVILRNHAVEVAAGLWIAGVDDAWSGRPDLRTALREVPAAGTTILLAHEPDYFDTVVRSAAPVTVQLSGHSHGGQVRLPRWEPDDAGNFTWAPVLPHLGRRYPIGLRTLGGRTVYTNRGLGVWPVPYRFNCRPELTLFTLHEL
jgi:predicted MPP superfamily phosphohydrolase